MIASAAGIRESFGQAGGSFQDLINRSLVASASSPAKAEELLRGAGKAGVAARQQGITVDELLAATSIMATAKGSADEGGSRLNALLMALAVTEPKLDARGRVAKDSPIQQTLRGRSLADIGSDEAIRAMSPVQLQKLLGSREAVEGLGIVIEQVSKLKELTPRVAQGVQENKLERGIAIVEGDRRAMAGVNLQAQQGAQEVERLNRGQASLEVDAMLIRAQRHVEQAPQAGLLRRLFNATHVGIGSNLMQGDLSSAISGFSLPTALIGNAAKSEAGMMATSGLRTGLEAIGGDAIFLDFLDVMRRIGLGGVQPRLIGFDLIDVVGDPSLLCWLLFPVQLIHFRLESVSVIFKSFHSWSMRGDFKDVFFVFVQPISQRLQKASVPHFTHRDDELLPRHFNRGESDLGR
jgi:hypothetical protein